MLLKEATIHFYCLFDKSRSSDICTIMELKKLNWQCKHMKNVRSHQPCISKNFSTEFSKAQVLLCEYRKVQVRVYIREYQMLVFRKDWCIWVKKWGYFHFIQIVTIPKKSYCSKRDGCMWGLTQYTDSERNTRIW